MNLPDAIRILGLSKRTSLREAKAAYRRLAKKYHPDINSQENASRFLDIIAAYEFLRDYVARNKGKTSRVSSAQQTATEAPPIAVRHQMGTTALTLAPARLWLSRKAVYQRGFKDFVTALDQAFEESLQLLRRESQRFCERVFAAIGRRFETYSDASEIRSKLHRDVNRVLRREGVSFLEKLSCEPRHVVESYDNWLKEMRTLARRYSLPQTIGEYLSSSYGLTLTIGIMAPLVPTSMFIAAISPSSFLVGLSGLAASIIISLFGGRSIYRWFAMKQVEQNTTAFLAEAGLEKVDDTVLPVSKESTQEEEANKGALTGGMIGLLALGPIAGMIGLVAGGLLGGMSGREFEEFRAKAAENTANALLPVLQDFLDRIEHQFLAERKTVIERMRENFISNLRDEKLIYGL